MTKNLKKLFAGINGETCNYKAVHAVADRLKKLDNVFGTITVLVHDPAEDGFRIERYKDLAEAESAMSNSWLSFWNMPSVL